MLTTGSEETPPKRVRKLKVIEVKPRRRYYWAGPVVAIFLALMFILNAPISVLATDYTFGSEQVDLGSTATQSNRNAEDGSFETITETDQQADTDISASSEAMTIGTAGYSGGASSFPAAIDTKDDQYRTYTEANVNPTTYSTTIVPTGDGDSVIFTGFPATPTTDFDKVDDGASHDSDTTYLTYVAVGDIERLTMGDVSAPSGSPNIDVTIHCFKKDLSTGANNLQYGIRIGTTNYQGVSENPGAAYSDTAYTWTTNPATVAEWTYTEVNALIVYMMGTDATPDVMVTSIYVVVLFTYTALYNLDGAITWSGTSSTANTHHWDVNVQGKSSEAENFYLQLWDYVGSSWTTRMTVTGTSDADYTYTLTANERSGGGEIKVRFIGSSESSDTTQTIFSLDYMRVQRVDLLYEASVYMTATGVSAYGDIDLKMKGKSGDGESWNVQFWNYTGTPGWDTKYAVTTTTNTLVTTDIYRAGYISSGEMKVRFDNQGTPDQTQSVFSLDWLTVTHNNAAPTISIYGVDPDSLYEGETAHFFAVYTDADNDAPSYVRVVIDSTPYAMTANDSDSDYSDGKTYFLDKSDIPIGTWNFYFAVKDTLNGEVTTGTAQIEVMAPLNNPPVFTSTPIYSVANNSLYEYDANATDPEEDPLTYYLDSNATFLGVNPSTGMVSGTPHLVGSYWANVTVTDGIGWDYQNYSFDVTTTAPSFSSSPIVTGTNGTAYSYHAEATDLESETLIFDLGAGTNASFLVIGPSTGVITGTPSTPGWYNVNVTVTDGTYVVWQNYTLTIAEHHSNDVSGPIQISFGVVLMGVVLVMSGMVVWKYA